MAKSKRLGEFLVEWKFISEREVQAALDHGKARGIRIGEALIDLKLAQESQVYKALAAQNNMEYVDLNSTSIAPNAVGLIPSDVIRKFLILPLGMDGNRIRAAVHDPLDLETLDILRLRLGKTIKPVLASRGRIKAVIDDMFQLGAAHTIDKTVDKTVDRSMDASIDRSGRSIDSTGRSIDVSGKSIDMAGLSEDLQNDAAQAPIIKLVQGLIAEAVRSRASDIHVEPMKDRVRVRYRIDGECVERDKIKLSMKNPMISRLKIMAGIDIAEKRLPQDGRIKLTVDKAPVDFRVSTLPSYHGESVVLRILRPTACAWASRTWGSRKRITRRSRRSSRGPTGSSW